MATVRRRGATTSARSPQLRPRPVTSIDPSFHRAVLKIALELRKPSARSCEAIVEETVERMRIDPEAFRRYLGANGARNMSLLLSAIRRFGP
jgi:hypothetical protein